MLVLEALRAKHGDALLLHFGTAAEPRLAVIDGGPPGVYNDALGPRLEELRRARGLAAATPLAIDLVMVSHIDADHVAGLLQLVQKMKDLRDGRRPLPWRIDRFWHNSFDDILGNDDGTIAGPASLMRPASLGGLLAPEGSLILASVGQGRDLRKLLAAFDLAGNPPFGGPVAAGGETVAIGGLRLTVVAPSAANLQALQRDWDQKIQPLLRKEADARAKAEIAAYTDRSVYNLSSIVVLVEAEGRRILLTGDGRGDHTLDGLRAAGLLDAGGRIEVDVLKLPHHGSERDVDLDYFAAIRARHYVISADGKFDNPDLGTLRMISAARPDDDFTIHLTYPMDEFAVPQIGAAVADFFAREQAAGRRYEVATRPPGDLALKLVLA